MFFLRTFLKRQNRQLFFFSLLLIVAPVILSLIDVMLRRSSDVDFLYCECSTYEYSTPAAAAVRETIVIHVRLRQHGRSQLWQYELSSNSIFATFITSSLCLVYIGVNTRSICSNCKTRREQLPSDNKVRPLLLIFSEIAKHQQALEERINSIVATHSMDNLNFIHFFFLTFFQFP